MFRKKRKIYHENMDREKILVFLGLENFGGGIVFCNIFNFFCVE